MQGVRENDVEFKCEKCGGLKFYRHIITEEVHAGVFKHVAVCQDCKPSDYKHSGIKTKQELGSVLHHLDTFKKASAVCQFCWKRYMHTSLNMVELISQVSGNSKQKIACKLCIADGTSTKWVRVLMSYPAFKEMKKEKRILLDEYLSRLEPLKL